MFHQLNKQKIKDIFCNRQSDRYLIKPNRIKKITIRYINIYARKNTKSKFLHFSPFKYCDKFSTKKRAFYKMSPELVVDVSEEQFRVQNDGHGRQPKHHILTRHDSVALQVHFLMLLKQIR